MPPAGSTRPGTAAGRTRTIGRRRRPTARRWRDKPCGPRRNQRVRGDNLPGTARQVQDGLLASCAPPTEVANSESMAILIPRIRPIFFFDIGLRGKLRIVKMLGEGAILMIARRFA